VGVASSAKPSTLSESALSANVGDHYSSNFNVQSALELAQAQLAVAEQSIGRLKSDIVQQGEDFDRQLNLARKEARLATAAGWALCIVLLCLEYFAPEHDYTLRISVILFAFCSLSFIYAHNTRNKSQTQLSQKICACQARKDPKQVRCLECNLVSDAKLFKNRFVLLGEIGKGAYSTVRTALDRQTDTNVAIKVVQKANMTQDQISRLVTEVTALEALKHPHIVKVGYLWRA